jgi:HEAT repeat protein
MTYLLRYLNLRRNEVPRLALAAAVFFLAQVDDGIIKSVASAVFNIRAGVDKLPLMYTWIAVVFSASMALLSWLTAKVARQRLLIGLMVFVAVVLTANALILFYEFLGGGPLSVQIYSFLFVSSELARTLMNFQIWIVAGGICYTSRAKVLFPLLASSAVLGDITGGFVVRFLGEVLESHMLYALAVLNMVLILFLLRRLLRRYFVVQGEGDGEEAATVGENMRYFARSPYLILLFVLSIAVFALYTAIHYGFNVVGRQYYSSEKEITEFFGLFFGLTGVATLFVTTFLLQRLLRWIGTGNVYLWVCVVYSVVAALLLAAFEGVLPLPIIAAIFAGNLVNYLLLDSVISPAYQVLIKLVPQRNSDGTRMIMEGGFMLLGGLVGAGITALHAREWLTLGQLFMVLLVLSLAMIFCGFLLKRSYTAVLIQAVREQDFDLEDDQAIQALGELIAHSPDFSRSLLLHRDDGVRQLGIEMLHRSPGPAGEQVCLGLLEHENPRIRSAALAALHLEPQSVVKGIEAVLLCLQDEDGEVRLSAVRCISNQLDGIADVGLRERIGNKIAGHLRTEDERASMQAECLMVLERLEHHESSASRGKVLATLLASAEAEELMAGIEAAGSVGGRELGGQLLPFLDYVHPAVREAAVRSLGELGEDQGFAALLRMLNDPDPDVIETTVQALGKIRSPELCQRMVAELQVVPLRQWEGLLSALVVQDDEVFHDGLMASCRQRLVEASRYLVAIRVLGEMDGDFTPGILIDQLYAETQVVRNGVVRLLGHLGDTGVVGALVGRLSDDDEEARENAVELLENIADRELLALLLPLLESDEEERARMAERTAGWGEVDQEQVLRHLLMTAGPWTQVAAVWSAVNLGCDELCRAAAGELSEEAGQILTEIIEKKDGGDMAETDQPLTTMEKITFLKESPFFATLPLEELYHVALSIEEESVKEEAVVIKEGTTGDKMYIVVSGELEVKKEDGPRLAVLGEKQVFGDMALLDNEPRSASVVAMGPVHLLSLQRSSLERILRRYSSIAFNLMRILSHRLREAQAS